MNDTLEVWLDAEFLPELLKVGLLHHDRGQVRFEYDPSWLKHSLAFSLDPDLSLGEGSYFPQADQGNFRVFEDSAPDRWGQTLMKRHEALEAKDQDRTPRTLHAWDFLLGVQDLTRQGALRLRRPGHAAFLANEDRAAPPVASLRELEAVAREITARRIDDLDALRRWLAVLVAPGASLGGARPKANFTEQDGTLWIAKFPARDDDRDIGAWEFLTHRLAERAGVTVPPAQRLSFGKDFHTFCVQRFDRRAGRRRFYASAMALLRKNESEGTSYLELAEFIQHRGAKGGIKQDLEQLFRRVVFNVAVGNRDDHLRNHGFIMAPEGWRLAPAFDLNPNIDKAEHVLNLDESDHRPDLHTVIATSPWYGLKSRDAGARIVQQVLAVTRTWRACAQQDGIARADIEGMAAAFAHSGA